VQPIRSAHNSQVKLLRSLRLRKGRERTGCFLVEGIRAVEEALTMGAPVETVVYAPDLVVSERAGALIERVAPERRLALSAELFRTLSDREQPQGIAAVVRVHDRPLASIPSSGLMLVIVAVQLSDPGNLGAIIRTADAAGASGVVVVEPSVDLYDPQTVRATMGSLFALPVVRLKEEPALAAWLAGLRSAGLPVLVVASSAHAEQVHFDVDYDRAVVLLVGNERHGLPDSLRQMADLSVRLPMAGRATSLNVSAAAAALVYEIVRQRRAGSPQGPAPLGRQT
jgi:TrmH family RNA methyltransferase